MSAFFLYFCGWDDIVILLTIWSLMKSQLITDEVKEQIENNTFIKNYGTTTNKKTLKMAAEELEMDGQERVNRWMTTKPEKASPFFRFAM